MGRVACYSLYIFASKQKSLFDVCISQLCMEHIRRFREECLNKHWLTDIVHVSRIINDWRNGEFEGQQTDITN